MTEAHWVTRDMLRSSPETLFVFGDNMKQRGLGGQAREMRGEPNAVGIPTKWRPSNDCDAFFIDTDLPAVQGVIDQAFDRITAHLESGGEVVWPSAGIGTGLADLSARAPRIFEYIEARRAALTEESGG
jgi:hypothetical protein